MGTLSHPCTALQRHWLYLRHRRSLLLDSDWFAGRRVLVVGPARTVDQELESVRLDDYDVVVKMNNGIDVPIRQDGALNWRCDVLFHSLADIGTPLSVDKLEQAGVRCIVHRTPGKSYVQTTLRAQRSFKDLGYRGQVQIIAPDFYQQLRRRLHGAAPTTGLVCLSYLLGCQTAAVAVVGFTFYTTRYVPGYDDSVDSDAAASQRVRDIGHHDPERERRMVATLLRDAARAGKSISLGDGVRAALARP